MNTIHQQLREARRDHQRAQYRLCVLLAELHAKKLYQELGCASTVQYAEVKLGMEARQARELLAIGRRLPELPVLAATFAQGQLSWTKVREVRKVATSETDRAWTEVALRSDSRSLERMVVASNPGDAPPREHAPLPGPARVRLVFEVEVADAERLRQAFRLQRRQGEHGPETSDGELLAALADHFIATQPAEGAANDAPSPERFRVVLQQCPDCKVTHVGRAGQPASPVGTPAGDPGHLVEEATVEMAACDAELLDLGQGAGRKGHRVRPAVRRAVQHRDGHRCVVPYCRSRTWLDIHHIHYQGRGGSHEMRNLLVLCGHHHAALHRGLLRLQVVDGVARFYHPDGQPFGPGPMEVTDGEGRTDLHEAVMARLAGRPHGEGELARSLKLSVGRVMRILGMLRALGQVTQALTGEWVRTDQLALSAPGGAAAGGTWRPLAGLAA